MLTHVNSVCVFNQHVTVMISVKAGRDDEKYLYNKQLKIALLRAIFIIVVNRELGRRELQDLQHLLRRSADTGFAAVNHDRALDQFRVRHHGCQ